MSNQNKKGKKLKQIPYSRGGQSPLRPTSWLRVCALCLIKLNICNKWKMRLSGRTQSQFEGRSKCEVTLQNICSLLDFSKGKCTCFSTRVCRLIHTPDTCIFCQTLRVICVESSLIGLYTRCIYSLPVSVVGFQKWGRDKIERVGKQKWAGGKMLSVRYFVTINCIPLSGGGLGVGDGGA